MSKFVIRSKLFEDGEFAFNRYKNNLSILMIDDIILPKHKEARSFQFSDSSDSKEDKSNILCVMKIAILEEDINNCIPERFNFSNGSK